MRRRLRTQHALRRLMCVIAAVVLLNALPRAQMLSLQALVTPSTVILRNGHPVTFAVHGFIEFKSPAELFAYIDSQTRRWDVPGGLNKEQRRQLLRNCFGGESKAGWFRWRTSARWKHW